jgi:CO/xanthine dehydrogenase FAD-binding subunit
MAGCTSARPPAEVLESELAQRALPALAEGVWMIATPQIRRVAHGRGRPVPGEALLVPQRLPCYKLGAAPALLRGAGRHRHHSILGARRLRALCPADLAPILAALDARLVVAGPGRLRDIAMADLYRGRD